MPHAEIPRGEVLPPPMRPFPGQGPPPFSNRPYDAPDHHLSMPPPIPRLHENIPPGRIQVPPEILTFRLLCSNDKVGSIIGKGGNIIKSLQHETGCEIKVLETTPESDDRIVVISGPSVNLFILPILIFAFLAFILALMQHSLVSYSSWFCQAVF